MGTRFSASINGKTDLFKSPQPGLPNKSRMTSTAPNSIMSRTFENYVKARENAERRNKEFVDRLNDLSLAKIKNQKKAERSMFS